MTANPQLHGIILDLPEVVPSASTAAVALGLAEMLLGEIGEPGFAAFSDLNMLVLVTGQERTLAEYCALLKQANLRLDKSQPLRPPMTVIEAVAA